MKGKDEEVIASLAAAKEISVYAAGAAVLSKLTLSKRTHSRRPVPCQCV